MNGYRGALSAGVLCAVAQAAGGTTTDGVNGVRSLPADDYGGMVINQTVTIVGRDFYRHFIDAWRDLPLTERYSVSIQERPSVRWGSRIVIEYAQRGVYQTFLSPRRDNLREKGLEAAQVAHRNAIDTEVQRLFFRNPDLGRDEL